MVSMLRRSSVWGKGRAFLKVNLYSVYYPSVMIAYRHDAGKIIANYIDYRSVKEYIHMGLDTNIIDPDIGANIARKLEDSGYQA